jgi:Fe-S oxidoreductase
MVNRGVYDISEVVDNIYECACCSACTKECVTGWDPVMFIKQARVDAALEGKLPEYINVLIDNCLETGNAYGITDISDALKKAIEAHSEKTDTLLFLGVDARYKAPECAINAIKAFEKTGVKFTVLADELPSGQQLEYLISAVDETKQQMEECAKQLNGYKTVVAYDPQDAKVLKREYKEWNIKLDALVMTYTQALSENIDKLNAKKTDKAVVYQDPFQLSRELNETEEARKVISAYRVLNEMLVHGKDTMWAGNILMAQWMPEVIKGVAQGRIDNAKGVKADTIVTASVSEYVSLKSVATDVNIISVEELILG